MPEQKTYSASRIFTGESWLTDHAVVTANGRISEIIPLSSLPSSQQVEQFDNCIIVPAFIDLQIYGAYEKLFAVYPDTDALHKLVDYCRRGGAAWCLPTVATNTKDTIFKCIDAIKDYWKEGGEGIPGLHLEGPWINPAKRGAHIRELINRPAIADVSEILTYGKGVIRMITLAPEECSQATINLILSYDIVISAGHSDATYKEVKNGFSMGITAVTHLFNAMSPLHHREPGLVGAAMDDPSVMASIIPDGHHVDYAAIRIAKQVMKERLFAITDAVTGTEKGYYQHQAAGDKYEAAGILSGSALTMNKAAQNLISFSGIETGEALRMCSLYPARVLKMEHDIGRIEMGFKTPLLVLDMNMEVKHLI